MSNKNMEMMKKLLEDKKKKNDQHDQQRGDKKLGTGGSGKKSNQKIGIRKV